MRKLTIILFILAIAFESCKKEEKIHPYYPHTVKLTDSKVTYNAWVKGVDKTLDLPYQLFFDGQLSDYTGWNTITFLNDSLFYWGEKPSYYSDEEMLKNAEHYFIHGDSIYHDYWFSMVEFYPPIYIVRLLGIGNRNAFIDYRCSYNLGIPWPNEREGIGSPGNLDWNIFVSQGSLLIPGPNPNADTLAVVNCAFKYR